MVDDLGPGPDRTGEVSSALASHTPNTTRQHWDVLTWTDCSKSALHPGYNTQQDKTPLEQIY